jgi:hypothetical protein
MSRFKEQQGFVTFAINTPEVNYLELAYTQALNIKATQKENKYAVIVDPATEELITDEHKKVFDYVKVCPKSDNPFAVEPDVFYLTPFKETIKLESDLLFTRSIDHWWTTFRLKDVCLSHGTKNYIGINSAVRKYRELFDRNNLPDVYNGLMYFRYSQTSAQFFNIASMIFNNWDSIKTELVQVDEKPTTDVVYAITALVLGEDAVTMPTMDFLNFVHMKPAINGYPEGQSFRDTFVTEFNEGMIRVNNINQYHPFHYNEKDFTTEEMREYYRSRIS